MHPLASLGPVDPQITVHRKEGPQQFAYEDVAAYTSFLKDEGGITEQEQKAGLLSHLVDQIEPSVIGASKRASMQSIVMAEKLSRNYFSHGHAVCRSEAKELGLRILDADPELESILWELFNDFERLMSMNEVFDPTALYLSHPDALPLLAPPPVVNFELVHATVEGPKHTSSFVTRGKIIGARQADMNYIIGTPQMSVGWHPSYD